MVRTSSGEREQQQGVTLIELLVVAALASILLALVFPSIRAGMSTLQLRSSAQRLAAAVKFARDEAIYKQRPFELEIDKAKGTVTVADTGGKNHSFNLPTGVRVGTILPADTETSSPTRRFLFSPDGSAVPFQITLQNRRRRIQVTGNPLTGFPTVSDLKPLT